MKYILKSFNITNVSKPNLNKQSSSSPSFSKKILRFFSSDSDEETESKSSNDNINFHAILSDEIGNDDRILLRDYLPPLGPSKPTEKSPFNLNVFTTVNRTMSLSGLKPTDSPTYDTIYSTVSFDSTCIVTDVCLYLFPALIKTENDSFLVTNHVKTIMLSDLSIAVLPYCIGNNDLDDDIAIRTTDICICTKDCRTFWLRCEDEEQRASLADTLAQAVSYYLGDELQVEQMEYNELLESITNGEIARICNDKKNIQWKDNIPPLMEGHAKVWIYSLSYDLNQCTLLMPTESNPNTLKYLMLYRDDLRIFENKEEMEALRFVWQSKYPDNFSLSHLPSLLFVRYDLSKCFIKAGLLKLNTKDSHQTNDPLFASFDNNLFKDKDDLYLRLIDTHHRHIVVLQFDSLEEQIKWIKGIYNRFQLYCEYKKEDNIKTSLKKVTDRKIAELAQSEDEKSQSIFESYCEIYRRRCYIRILPVDTIPMNLTATAVISKYIIKVFVLDEKKHCSISIHERINNSNVICPLSEDKPDFIISKLHLFPTLIIAIPHTYADSWILDENKKLTELKFVEELITHIKLDISN